MYICFLVMYCRVLSDNVNFRDIHVVWVSKAWDSFSPHFSSHWNWKLEIRKSPYSVTYWDGTYLSKIKQPQYKAWIVAEATVLWVLYLAAHCSSDIKPSKSRSSSWYPAPEVLLMLPYLWGWGISALLLEFIWKILGVRRKLVCDSKHIKTSSQVGANTMLALSTMDVPWI